MGKANINSTKLQRQLQTIAQEASGKAANQYREKVRSEILTSGRIDTGEMFNDIDIVPAPDFAAGRGRWKVIFRADHFRYQDEGTRGAEASRGSVLRFKPKGATAFVFAKRVRGVTPANFIAKAKARMSSSDWA